MKFFVGIDTKNQQVVGPNTIEKTRKQFIADKRPDPELVMEFNTLEEARRVKGKIINFLNAHPCGHAAVKAVKK